MAVQGVITLDRKRNASAEVGCKLYLTKPLGIGVLTTAEKKGKLKPEHQGLATAAMCQMNLIGSQFAEVAGVTAMTDVTGFGLLGHLAEICEGSNLNALHFDKIKLLDGMEVTLQRGCVSVEPTNNFESYGHKIGPLTDYQRGRYFTIHKLGGLLIAVKPESEVEILEIAKKAGIELSEVGVLKPRQEGVLVEVR